MNRLLASAVVALACSGVVRAQSTQPAKPFNQAPTTRSAEIPITAVKLFSSGVGYFERNGAVNGDDRTTLNFKSTQINDILKSLVLQDLNGGTLGTITYPSQDPVSRTLAGFSVDIASNPSLLDLLTQLRGSPLTITYGPEPLNGILLGTEQKHGVSPDGKDGTVMIPVLNMLIGTKIRAIPLDDVRDIQLNDPKLQHDLTAALMTVASTRNQDQKPLDIEFHGTGQRQVRIGYVVESPVWKTSYRLVMNDKPNLQGWAMIENQTDSDWTDVQLSLVSGRPISFIENLYSPIYLPRPTVQLNLFGGLQPPIADVGGQGIGGGAGPMAYSKALNGAIQARQSMTMQAADKQNNLADIESAPQPLDPVASVISAANGVSLGELFSYDINHVTLPRHESAMLPVVTDAIDAQRLSIFNQSTSTSHPLYGVRLKNSTTKHLLQGPVTVFDHGSYAGDAQLDNVPPGQSRLLSYGVDLEMTIDANEENTDVQVRSASISKGTMTIARRTVSARNFKIANKSSDSKKLAIEDPLRSGWDLIDTPKPVETTNLVNRFQLDVAPGESKTFTVKQQVVNGEELAILPTDMLTLTQYISTGEISKSVRDALQKVIELKAAVVATQQQIDDRQTNLKSIDAEQNRMRENLKAVEHQSDYYVRLMSKLNDQETQIEKLQSEVVDLQKTLATQTKTLNDYVSTLQVE